jgi:two-component system phosphate regulon sensor histidine kinase PhoR
MSGGPSIGVAAVDQSATEPTMPQPPLMERAFIEALDEPALLVERGTILVANRAAKALLGPRIEKHDLRFAIRHPQVLEQVAAHRSADLEVEGIADPGRPWLLQIRALEEGPVLVRMIDRSDTVAAERMRTDFVANASHELRTPLSTIGGYAETLAEEQDIPAATRSSFGRTIRDEAQRMLRIIEDLMSLSRIQADRFVAPSEAVSIGDVLENSVVNATAGRPTPDCAVSIDVPLDLPAVRGDRSQLVQLFDNLVSNALRYGCGAADASVEIGAASDGRFVVVTVNDHGAGIAREHLPRITERFYRVDAARSRASGGTGLGLAIVKHIVERHKGSLEIRSTVGLGTSVTVRLPVA